MPHDINKWASKIDGNNRKRLYDIQKPFMVKKEATATWALVKIEKEIKIIANGQPIIHLPYYIIFGKEIYRLLSRHKSEALINELEILQTKWILRGLDFQILDNIKKLYVPIYIKAGFFIMDASLLDGIDRLA